MKASIGIMLRVLEIAKQPIAIVNKYVATADVTVNPAASVEM